MRLEGVNGCQTVGSLAAAGRGTSGKPNGYSDDPLFRKFSTVKPPSEYGPLVGEQQNKKCVTSCQTSLQVRVAAVVRALWISNLRATYFLPPHIDFAQNLD